MQQRLFHLIFAAALFGCGGPAGDGDGGSDAAADGGGTDAAADTGGSDAGADTGGSDTGATDAGGGCPANFAGCNVFEDRSASGADRTITTVGFTYSPDCMKIAVGQSVTFNVSFASHPLRGDCAPAGAAEIPDTSTGTTTSVTFNAPGDYGFHCAFHGQSNGSGMAGTIRVE